MQFPGFSISKRLRAVSAPCAVLTLCVAGALPAGAQGSVGTSYELIAEGGTGLTYREVGLASISQTGRVAFEGQNAGRLIGVYTSPGGVGATFTTIASPSVSGTNGFQPSALSINSSGTVAFSVFDLAFGASKVYAGNGGTLAWVSDPATAPSLPNFVPYGGFATINDAGAVAYGATSFNPGNGQSGHYVGVAQGGAFSPVVPASVNSPLNGFPFNNFTGADINNSGQVAYSFNSTANRGYVFRRSTDGSITTIATQNQPQTTIAMNDSGFVAYTGLNNSSITLSNGLTSTIIGNATTVDPLTGLSLVSYANFSGGSSDFISVNNLNQVAFRAGGIGGSAPNGVYVGNGSQILTVAQVGGSLFGSTITGLSLSSQAINDLGQVVFTVNLANGRNGIVRATLPGAVSPPSGAAPEPASLALILPVLGVVEIARRKRRVAGQS